MTTCCNICPFTFDLKAAMLRGARSLRDHVPKRELGLGPAIRRVRVLRAIGQDELAQNTGLSQGYISLIENGEFNGATEDTISRIAAALDVEPWVLLAQAHGLLIRDVEPFGDEEHKALDAFGDLEDEQREVVLEVAAMMKRPPPRQKPTKRR